MSSSSTSLPDFNVQQARKITFSEVLNNWLNCNRIKLKGATVNKYQNLIKTHIVPDLGDMDISEITATEINLFLKRKLTAGRLNGSGGLAPSYVRSIVLIINAALKYASAEHLCAPLTTPLCKPPILKTDLNILSAQEQQTFENILLKKIDSTRVSIVISLYTGLRIGELCALSWNDVDLKNRVIKVRHTIARIRTSDNCEQTVIDSPKTKSSNRDIPISSTLLPILVKYKDISKGSFLLGEKDNFLNPRTLEYRYHKLLKECNMRSMNFHTLRHTFATRCVEAGVDVKSLSEILGHANVGITLNTYVHPSMEIKRKQLEKLATVFF